MEVIVVVIEIVGVSNVDITIVHVQFIYSQILFIKTCYKSFRNSAAVN